MKENGLTTDCGRFLVTTLCGKPPFLPVGADGVIGVKIYDRGNQEVWGNDVCFSGDSNSDSSTNRVYEMLVENIFESMELKWTERLGQFLPKGRL